MLTQGGTVKVVFTMPSPPNTLQVADVASELLDGLNLLMEEVAFNEVGHLEVLGLISSLVELEERLVDVTLQLKGMAKSLNASHPIVLPGCLDVLQDDYASALVLEFHELFSMFLLLISTLLKVRSKVGQSHVGPVVIVRLSKEKKG